MCDKRPSMADSVKNLKIISKEYQYSAECTTPSSPHDKTVYDSHKASKDREGKLEASQDELYLNWDAPSHFELMNKVTRHQSTLSLFTMVKQAHLLSEEQLTQIKKSEDNEHFDQCYRPTLKRCGPSGEAFGSRTKKFSKTVQNVEIENSSENGEFFSQGETSDDCKDASRIYADQEVPVKDEEVTNHSTGQAMEVVDEQLSVNPVSKVSSFGDRPSFNSKSNNLNWQSSTGDHPHIENAHFYEEPEKGPCTKSFGLKFSPRHHGRLSSVNSPEKEGSSAYGAAEASSEQGGGELTLLTGQPGKNSELLEKPQIMIITKEEDPSHDKVRVVLSQSLITNNIACKYPPLPEKDPNNTGLCLSLHVICERALITDIVPSCNEQLKRDMATPTFLWKSELSYHGQPAPALGATNDEASNEPRNKVDEDGENTDPDIEEGPLHLIRPLPKTTCNRPRLGLSRKLSNKRSHPYFKKHSNEKPN